MQEKCFSEINLHHIYDIVKEVPIEDKHHNHDLLMIELIIEWSNQRDFHWPSCNPLTYLHWYLTLLYNTWELHRMLHFLKVYFQKNFRRLKMYDWLIQLKSSLFFFANQTNYFNQSMFLLRIYSPLLHFHKENRLPDVQNLFADWLDWSRESKHKWSTNEKRKDSFQSMNILSLSRT